MDLTSLMGGRGLSLCCSCHSRCFRRSCSLSRLLSYTKCTFNTCIHQHIFTFDTSTHSTPSYRIHKEPSSDTSTLIKCKGGILEGGSTEGCVYFSPTIFYGIIPQFFVWEKKLGRKVATQSTSQAKVSSIFFRVTSKDDFC